MIRTLLRSDTTVAIRGPDQLRGGLERGHVVSRSDLISHVLTLFLTLSFLELKVKGDQKIKNTALSEITASTGFRTRWIRHSAPSRTGGLGCHGLSRVLPKCAAPVSRLLPLPGSASLCPRPDNWRRISLGRTYVVFNYFSNLGSKKLGLNTNVKTWRREERSGASPAQWTSPPLSGGALAARLRWPCSCQTQRCCLWDTATLFVTDMCLGVSDKAGGHRAVQEVQWMRWNSPLLPLSPRGLDCLSTRSWFLSLTRSRILKG